MTCFSQQAFAAGLFETSSPPAGLRSWNSPIPTRRYDVYRNNVTSSLRNALASRFPAAEKIVGYEFFQAMAETFIRSNPPRSPLLMSYGEEFPDYVETFEPARDLIYLADVMRLELARGRAYHAADAEALALHSLATIDPVKLGSLIFTPHPSLTVFSSPHPAVTIWAMNDGKRALAPIDDWQGEDALVVRPQLIVNTILVPPGGGALFRGLVAGKPLGEAVEAAGNSDDNFDLSTNLTVLLTSGAFTAYRYETQDENN